MYFAKYPRQVSMLRKRNPTGTTYQRKLWAIKHANGVVSIIKARSGPHAVWRALQLFGPSHGPFTIEKPQDQAIVCARALGAQEL